MSGSIHRYHVLKALRDHPLAIRDLKNELNAPRPTIQRNVKELEEKGWVKRVEGGYQTTLIGRLILDEFTEAVNSVRQVQSVAPFFEWTDDLPGLAADTLEGSVVTTPEPHRPHNPMNALIESLRDANRVKALVPTLSALFLDRYFSSERAAETVVELTLSKDVAKMLRHFETATDIRFGKQDNIDCYVYEGEIPIGIFRFNGQLSLTSYDEEGRVRALLESETEPAINWAENLYDQYRSTAVEFSEVEIAK
ncbi:MAG: MarR family transcriptional regulator [Euryarchaeota archaeon]|nr:MarR family transcriptional regulator [Euryarchaeota archaeon]